MLGYKYTNIKIQIALIKQIMYSYLFNLFIASPNIFLKLILTNFSKDTDGKNSKEQYENFIKLNQNIFIEFYKNLPPKVNKYMSLAVILNKDMKTNFDSFNSNEIFSLGNEELQNIFFDVFFVFLEEIRKEFNIDLDKLLDKDNLSESKTSFDEVFKSSKLIPDRKDIKKPILIQSLNANTSVLSESEKTQLLQRIIINKGLLNDDELLRKLFDASYGIHGEFYYKIKDSLDVKLNCGNTTRKNIVIFSIRNVVNEKENKEFLGVQQYFNWKTLNKVLADETYRNLEQFIFVRDQNIKQNLNFDSNKFFTFNKSFNNEKYLGAKILNRKEILELREKLDFSGDDSGFLAIIPLDTIEQKDVNYVNNFLQNLGNTKNIYLSGFSEDEKKSKMSATDVLKLLGLKSEGPLSRTIVYQKNPYASFDVNELFDVYFSALNSTYYLNEISKNLFNVEEILKKETDLSSKIPEKEGKFLLDFKLIEDIFAKLNTVKYFTIKRVNILDIKLSVSNEEKFQDIGNFTTSPLPKGFIGDINLNDPFQSLIINNLSTAFLRKKYYDKFLNVLEKEEFNSVKDSLFPSDILNNDIIEKINFGVFDYTIPDDLKSLRSYKNYSDFLKYYIDIVEALAKESADRV